MQENKPIKINLKWLFKKAIEGLKWAYSSEDMNPSKRDRKADKNNNPGT